MNPEHFMCPFRLVPFRKVPDRLGVRFRPTIMGSDNETENKKGFPFIEVKPASGAVGGDGSFLFAAHSRKDVLFAHICTGMIALHRCHESSPHRARITTKLGECMLHEVESLRCQVWGL